MNLFKYENELKEKGINIIAGVDEAGRGPIAGPIVAAAVVLDKNLSYDYIDDSKKLSVKKRKKAYNKLLKEAKHISYYVVDESIIDEINILNATKIAMKKSLLNLEVVVEHALIDAVSLDTHINTTSIIKGDLKSKSIQAASIIAKEVRDEIMIKYHEKYPKYDFINNKGYLTKKHKEALNLYGPIKIHRKSFEPVKSMEVK